MVKLVAIACLILTSAVTLADEWKPPENPDPTTILREAKADAQKRDYKTALEKHVWYHKNALQFDPAQGGVRLSFALGYWLDLAKVYPPALDRLREFREEAANAARKGIGRFEGFHDFASINRTLGEQSKTIDLFLEFDKNEPKVAARVYPIAQQELLDAKQYEVCGRYVDPDKDLAAVSELYRLSVGTGGAHKDMLVAMANRSLKNQAATLVALLVVTDKKEKAAEVVKSAKKLRDDADYHSALDEALKGEFPKGNL